MKTAFGILSGAFCALVSLAASAEPAPAIIVVDTTAQMGAKLGAQRKIDLLKTAVPEAMRRLEAGRPAALWAFGTQPARKCEDTSQLAALQPGGTASDAIGQALRSIEPKAGRSPAFATVRAALKSTPDSEKKPLAIVLIAGAGDDCGGDICASARALQAIYPKARLSVVGVGMAKPAADTYTCVARAMGGEFLPVKSAAELDRALRQTLGTPDIMPQAGKPPKQQASPAVVPPKQAPVKATALPSLPKPPKAPVPALENTIAIAPPALPEPNVILTAALTAGAPQLDAGVTWRVTKIIPSPAGQERASDFQIWAGGGGPARIKLADGRYQVDATYGLASVKSEISVASGKTEKAIAFEAGTIAAQGLQSPKGQPAGGVLYTLYRKVPSAEAVEVARSSAEPALFHVNAGDYTLTAASGQAKIEAQVTVVPGKVSAVNMALNVGILDLKTFAVDGNPKLIPAWHRLYAANQSSSAAVPLMTIAGPAQRLQLPVGTYRLETSYGQVREVSTITVSPGQITSQSVILNAGEARIQLPAQPQQLSATATICSIFDVGSDRSKAPLGRAIGPDFSFIVKAGTYDVECRKGGGVPAAPKQAQVRVIAGETQTVSLAD